MYIWIGIDMDDQLREIGKKTREIEQAIGFLHSNFTLPLHVSLKISFFVPDAVADAVMRDISHIYREVRPFSVPVRGVEKEPDIVWIRMGESEGLNRLHDALNEMLLSRYGVPLHEYDTDYLFHTTLFMENDASKIDRAYEAVKSTPVPAFLKVQKLVIGTSPTGKLGSFSVVHVYEI